MGFRQSIVWCRLASLPIVRDFSLHLGLFCLVMLISVLSNGFDLSVYNSIQAMDAFQQEFGNACNPRTGRCTIDTLHLSMLNSFPMIAYAVSLFIAALVGEAFGRRTVYVLMTCICLIGVGVTYSAKTYGQILAGRIIVNTYCGMESWLIPLFTAELAPPKVRGALVACYILGRLLGTLLITIVGWRTSSWTGNASWRTPIAVLFAPPSLALLLTWLVPESPRWLLRKGKEQSALKNLRYLHGGNERADVELELVLLKESLELEAEKGSWLDLFRGTNARRTTIAMMTNFIGMATGQAFVNIYVTIFLKSLHVGNPFMFTAINQACAMAGAIMFLLLVDRIGRRTLYFTSGTMAAAVMMTIGALGTHAAGASHEYKLAIVAFLAIFGFFYISSFAQLAALTPAEIPSLKLRDKTAMMGWSIQNLTNFVATFTVPYLMNAGYGNLGAKVGFIYGSIAFAGVVWAYLFFPELKGRSLEEIDEMLRQKVPARKTSRWRMNADSVGVQLTKMEDNPGQYGTAKTNISHEHIEDT